MSMDGLLLMDDLLEWLAFGFWTTPMDEPEMVLFFGTPSNTIHIITIELSLESL